jgi:metal transporter CNNM
MWADLVIVIVLVVLSGTFAGLTLALFGIKLSTLERKIRLNDTRAKKVYRIRKNGNLLLCTLLLGNVASYTIMAIFLGSITSGVIAGFVATALIFVFGEILPQAVFPKYALEIGAKLSWLVWICLVIFYPVAAPVSWVLDRLFGKEEPVLWSKRELGEIIKYHEEVGDGIIDEDEERIILGALSFSDKEVGTIMIPKHKVFLLEPQAKMTPELFEKIKESGYSRIPVYESRKNEIKGILYTKNLIGEPANSENTALDFCSKKKLIIVDKSTHLDELLNSLVNNKLHMALVLDEKKIFIGIATLKDIIAEILKTELEDIKN